MSGLSGGDRWMSGGCPVDVRWVCPFMSGPLSGLCPECCPECPKLCPVCPVHFGHDHALTCPVLSDMLSDMLSGAVRGCPGLSGAVRGCPMLMGQCNPDVTIR